MNKPWEDSTGKIGIVGRQLTIGLLMSDGIADPHPPIVRSLQETARALEAAGHKVIPWKPLFHKEIVDVISAMFFTDGGNNLRALLKKGDEEPLPFLAKVLSSVENQCSIEQGWEVSEYLKSLLRLLIFKAPVNGSLAIQ